VACRPQDNPTFTSSDGVPPELAVLGFRRRPACTGQTGRRHWSNRPAQGFAGVDRFDDRSLVLAHSSVLARFCVNNISTRAFAKYDEFLLQYMVSQPQLHLVHHALALPQLSCTHALSSSLDMCFCHISVQSCSTSEMHLLPRNGTHHAASDHREMVNSQYSEKSYNCVHKLKRATPV
jgi:hypothetical protein